VFRLVKAQNANAISLRARRTIRSGPIRACLVHVVQLLLAGLPQACRCCRHGPSRALQVLRVAAVGERRRLGMNGSVTFFCSASHASPGCCEARRLLALANLPRIILPGLTTACSCALTPVAGVQAGRGMELTARTAAVRIRSIRLCAIPPRA